VILGAVGDNFAAGMTGGMAFVYDPADVFPRYVNPESVVFQRLASAHWEGVLKGLVEEHVAETQSRFAARILADWPLERGHFWQIAPQEMLTRLEHPLSDAEAAAQRA
jgi:glutamate synthase (NADPH/NADH) large chain